MPQYVLRCTNEECGHEFEKICSFSQLEELKCPECNSSVKNVPVVSASVIRGFSEANGYHREEIMYDGSKPRAF